MLNITIKAENLHSLRVQLSALLLDLGPASTEKEQPIVPHELQPELGAEEIPYDLEKDVIPTVRAFVKRNGREAGLKLLGKYGVKATKDLAPEHFTEVMDEAR